MWRPAQRIKYRPQPGSWPTRREAAASLLFSPVAIGPVKLRQRSWVPAMVPWRATEDGTVTRDLLDWYRRYAQGKPGAIVVEATGIRDIPSGPLLRIGHDWFMPGLRKLVETVRDASAGGATPEDAAFFGVEFARAGMDFLSLSRGGKFEDAEQPKVGAAAYPYTGRSGYECMPQYISDEKGPFGRNLPATALIRRRLRAAGFDMPVVAAGGIHGFAEAERILREGEADVIAAARQSIADPDWYLKTRLGCGDQVRVCVYSNYCEALDTRHKQVTCELWDRVDRDAPGVALSSDGKRRLLPPAWHPPRQGESNGRRCSEQGQMPGDGRRA